MTWVMADQDPLVGAFWGAITGAVFGYGIGYVISPFFDGVDFTNTPKRFMNKLNIQGSKCSESEQSLKERLIKRSAVPWMVVAGTLLSFSYAAATPQVIYDGADKPRTVCVEDRAEFPQCVPDTATMALRFAMGMGSTLAIAGAFWISLGAGKPEE